MDDEGLDLDYDSSLECFLNEDITSNEKNLFTFNKDCQNFSYF